MTILPLRPLMLSREVLAPGLCSHRGSNGEVNRILLLAEDREEKKQWWRVQFGTQHGLDLDAFHCSKKWIEASCKKWLWSDISNHATLLLVQQRAHAIFNLHASRFLRSSMIEILTEHRMLQCWKWCLVLLSPDWSITFFQIAVSLIYDCPLQQAPCTNDALYKRKIHGGMDIQLNKGTLGCGASSAFPRLARHSQPCPPWEKLSYADPDVIL